MEKNSMSAKQFIEDHKNLWSSYKCSWKKLDKHHIVVYCGDNYEVHWKFINNKWRSE